MEYEKAAEATGFLIGNQIADAVAKSYDGKITKVSRSSPRNNSNELNNYK